MNELDIYYRALVRYRAETQENRDCANFRKAIAAADSAQDQIVVIRNICTVEEDWIQAIEQGLVFVEKAIKEERQFIYSNGEVLEIEKVKHISKESVQHLAKHSNLITREQHGDDIIPEKLYSVERLNDYAVYENRFLYMLLCYLRNFVTIRYNKILDLSNKYEGNLQMDKHIDMPKRNVTLQVRLHEEKRDDNYLREHNAAKSAIDRIDLILKAVLAFLATPLMEITSKAPMLKPPITKTNVLKMDNNFKGAMALYDFILAYDKPGYRIDTKRIELSPFQATLAEEMSESVAMMSFLTYAHGLELFPMLKQNFSAEEARRKDEELTRQRQALEERKRRLAAREESLEDYILAQEQYIKRLEEENHQIDALHLQVQQLGSSNRQISAACDAAKLETEAVRQILSGIEAQHQQQMDEMKDAYDERIHQQLLQQEADMKALEADCQSRIQELNTQMQDAADAFQAQLTDRDSHIAALSQQHEQLTERNLLCEARLKALCALQGTPAEDADFTQKEQFDRLEQEYQAFTRFYQSHWNKTKKSIRSQLLNFQYLKRKSEQ